MTEDCAMIDMKTTKPQTGTWTLTVPDGRTWKAESPLRCCALEQRERVPASVALNRIAAAKIRWRSTTKADAQRKRTDRYV